MEIILKEQERIDDLEYKGMKIIQNTNGFCYGMDSVLLSDFAKTIKKNAQVADFGTGTGILGILLCAKTQLQKIVGIEIQEEVAEMAKRSIQLNQLEERFCILQDNIIHLEKYYKKGFFDAIVMNPPYKKQNAGLQNQNKAKLISRHEIEANLEQFIQTASQMLKDKGELYLVHRPERLAELCFLLTQYRLEPKEIRFVYPKVQSNANLVLIKAVKGAKSFLKILPPLIVYQADQTYTTEILEIYHKNEE